MVRSCHCDFRLLKSSRACLVFFFYIYCDAQTLAADKNGKVSEGPSPSAPSIKRSQLTIDHLIFHKVLGKGSFGKVGGLPRSGSLRPESTD